MKQVRKAVRTFLIEEDRVLAIKYTTNDNKLDYYDIPGGEIEEGEKSEEAAIREFKEESGIEIKNPQYAGNLVVEYPNRVFDFDVFFVSEYEGCPQQTLENISEWIKIDELLQKEKLFTTIYVLDKSHRTALLNKTNFKWHFIADENHNKLTEI